MTHLDSGRFRKSTGEESLIRAKEIAEDWYLGLRGKRAAGILKQEKTFADAAKQFTTEYELITEGERSAKWTEGHQIRLRLHLLPYFGELGLSQVTAGKVQEYRVHRATKPPVGSRKPKRKLKEGEEPPFKPRRAAHSTTKS